MVHAIDGRRRVDFGIQISECGFVHTIDGRRQEQSAGARRQETKFAIWR
jgi:hypothetical protein